MPADPSIYGMVRPYQGPADPLQQYGAMMQLRAMGDASVMNDLHRRKLEGDLAEEDAFKSRIADWVAKGGQGQLPVDAYAASPSRAATFDKTRLEGEKTRGEIKKNDAETHAKEVGLLRDQLARVTTDADLEAFREATLKYQGPKIAAQVPASVSDPIWPQFQSANIRDANQLHAALTPKMEKVDDGGKIRMVDVNPVTNPGVKGMVFNKTVTPGEAQQANQPVWDEARGVWVMRPQAAPRATAAAPAPAAAAPGAPGAAPAPAAPTVVKPTGLPPRQQDVHTLRHEFNQLPEVKAYRDVIPIVEAARSAPDTRAGDIQLGYAVGKILDPASVVREGEIKLAGDAATLLQKYEGELRTVTEGKGRMTPQTRTELLAMLDNAVKERQAAYQRAEGTYKGIAEQSGIPVDQVIITAPKSNAPAAPAAPKMFDAPPDPAKYKGKRLQADDGTVYVSDGASWVRQKKAQ